MLVLLHDKTLKEPLANQLHVSQYSLGLALTELGFPTLHTQHLHEAHGILDMWANKVFYPAIEKGKISLGEPDFDVITNHGYTATVDLPMALYFDQVKNRYPECKFILTTRESSEEWYRSFYILAVSVDHTTNICGNFLEYVHQLALYWRWLMAYISNDSAILEIPIGKPIPPPNKLRAISSYEQHNQRVRESIPSERLLEYNIKQGWEPLCEFLDINPCPTEKPFPKTNSAVSLQAQTMTVVAMFLTAFMLFTFPLVAVGFKKATGTKIVPWIAMKVRAKNCKKPRIKKK